MSLFKKRVPRDKENALYTWSTVEGRGRCLVLGHVAVTQIISWLTTGMFYTSFLMIYGIDIVNIGIITFIPYIASCFSIFSPAVLERFEKRKTFLAVTRFLYYFLNIFAITIIPEIISDAGARIIAFIVVIFLANVINAITGSGYTVWHIKFVEPSRRAEYFSVQSLVANFIGIGVSLISGIIADALSASAYGDFVIIALRHFSFFLAIVDVVLLILPKEYPYEHSKLPKVRDIFTLPLRSKPFMLTMAVSFLFTFATALPSSSLNYYLLNDVGVEYTFINAINMVYPLVQFFLLRYARKFVSRHGWFLTFAIFTLGSAPTILMYSCVTAANYLWLLPTVRIAQHFFGTYYNLANSNLIYTNLPPKDQTNYMSFHTLVANLASFLGMMVGTSFVAWCGERTVEILGMSFTSVQMLMWGEMAGYIILPLFIFANLKTLNANNN